MLPKAPAFVVFWDIVCDFGVCRILDLCTISDRFRLEADAEVSLAAVDSMLQFLPMTKYLISFPAEAMILSVKELRAAADESHAVIEEAKAAGVYVFGGGIDESIAPVMVGGDGSVSSQTYPDSRLNGGFAVLEVPTREEAVEWARKLATACRCAQELRAFMYDPAS